MDIKTLYEKYSINEWQLYDPHDSHYANFEPNIIATGHKIADTYYSFSTARSFLSDLECDNFGQLIATHDKLHLTYIRSKFFQSALAFYNYSIDLSWQTLWFYCAPADYRLIDDEEFYINYSKQCTLEYLNLKLYLGNKSKLRNIVNRFFHLDITQEIRANYNYLKHRGSFYTSGLGIQYGNFMGSINGKNYKQLTRTILDLSTWSFKIVEFDKLFKQYFDEIITETMPSNFSDTPIDILAVMKYHQKRNS